MGPPVQAKLTIGQPGDMYEREADAAAERIVAGRAVDTVSRLPAGGRPQTLQRQPEYEEEERVQAWSLQRQDKEEEEEDGLVQTKASPGGGPEMTPDLDPRIQAMLGGVGLAWGGTQACLDQGNLCW